MYNINNIFNVYKMFGHRTLLIYCNDFSTDLEALLPKISVVVGCDVTLSTFHNEAGNQNIQYALIAKPTTQEHLGQILRYEIFRDR